MDEWSASDAGAEVEMDKVEGEGLLLPPLEQGGQREHCYKMYVLMCH